MKLRPGSSVRLKTVLTKGGPRGTGDLPPKMVVHAIKGKSITCDWFEGKKLHRKSFHIDQLQFPLPEELTNEELQQLIEQETKAVETLEKTRTKKG
jgi:uncharacterized protein YodC (DUF2158 family)